MEDASNNKSEKQITQEELDSLKRSVKELMDIVNDNSDWFKNKAEHLKRKITQLNATLAKYANPADFSSENIQTIKDIYSDFWNTMYRSDDFVNSRVACKSVFKSNNDNSLTALISLMNNANAELKKCFENKKLLGDLINLFKQLYSAIDVDDKSKGELQQNLDKLKIDNDVALNFIYMKSASLKADSAMNNDNCNDNFVAKHKAVKAILDRFKIHESNLRLCMQSEDYMKYIKDCLKALSGELTPNEDELTVDKEIAPNHPLNVALKKLFRNPYYKVILSESKKGLFKKKSITIEDVISVIGIINTNRTGFSVEKKRFSESIATNSYEGFLQTATEVISGMASVKPSIKDIKERFQVWRTNRITKKTVQSLESMNKIDGEYVSKTNLTPNKFLAEIYTKLQLLYVKYPSSRNEIDSFFNKYTVAEKPGDRDFTWVGRVIYTNYKSIEDVINKALKIIKKYYRQINKKYSQEELTDFTKDIKYDENMKTRVKNLFSRLGLGDQELNTEYFPYFFIKSLPEQKKQLSDDNRKLITELIEILNLKEKQLGFSMNEYGMLFIEEMENKLGIAGEAQAKEKEGKEMETNQGTNTKQIISDAKEQLLILLKNNNLSINGNSYKTFEQLINRIEPDAEDQNAEMKKIESIIINMNKIPVLSTILNDIIEEKNSGSLNTDEFVIKATNIIANQEENDHRAPRVSPLKKIVGWFSKGKKDDAEETRDIDHDDAEGVLDEEPNDKEIVVIIKSTDKALRKLAKTLSKYKYNDRDLIDESVLENIQQCSFSASTFPIFLSQCSKLFIFREIENYLNEKYDEQLADEVATIENAINDEVSLDSCEDIIKSAKKIIRKLKVKTYITRVLVGTGVVGVLFVGSKLFNSKKSNETKQPEQPTDSVVDYQNTTISTEPAVTEDHIEMPPLTEATETTVVTTETTYTTEATIETTYTTEIAETSEPTSSNQNQEPSEDVVVDPGVVKNVTDTLIAYGIDTDEVEVYNMLTTGEGSETAISGQLIPFVNAILQGTQLPSVPPVITPLFPEEPFELRRSVQKLQEAFDNLHKALTGKNLTNEEVEKLKQNAFDTFQNEYESMVRGDTSFLDINSGVLREVQLDFVELSQMSMLIYGQEYPELIVRVDNKDVSVQNDDTVSFCNEKLNEYYGLSLTEGRTYSPTSSTSTDNN